jgi:hypothetical protein
MPNEPSAEASAAVVGVNVDLLEMHGVRLEHLDERKADWHVSGERHPEPPVALRCLEILGRRHFLEH